MRAVVTGGARGLGAAVAARLAADGAAVAVADVVFPSGAPPLAFTADISDEAACADLVRRACEALGGLDVLVNNAGIGGPSSLVVDTPPEEFRRVLDVNLTGTFLMSQAAGRVMIAQGSGGAIVNIGSIFGQQGKAGIAGYSSSKGGITLLTHSLALELAPHGIRVNTISPGNMTTDMHLAELQSRADAAGTSAAEQERLVRDSIPLGRHGTGDDIAGAVAWLVSPDAAYVTGQTIGVNGGVWLS